MDFISRRFDQMMTDEGHPAGSVRAVKPLAAAPARAEQALRDLSALLAGPAGREFAAAVQRVRRIVPEGTPARCDTSLFEDPAEQALHDTLAKLTETIAPDAGLADFAAAAAALTQSVSDFFDQVLVMADDPAIRANRLGLLASVYETAGRYLDWGQLP